MIFVMVIFEYMVTFFLITGQASSYQMLICFDLPISCAECKKQCDETSYGGICLNEGLKNATCCCKKSPPPSYYDPKPPSP